MNVVLVVIDTLRADHLGCYGYLRNTSLYQAPHTPYNHPRSFGTCFTMKKEKLI